MIWNVVAGTLGIAVQVAGFLIVLMASGRRRGVSHALVYAGVAAVYGYALIVAFSSLLAVPWQATNIVLAVGIVVSLMFRRTRRAIAAGAMPLLLGARRAWLSILIVVAVAALQLVVAGIDPELSIDGQLYHGPILANIVQSGSLWGWSVPNQYIYYTDLTMAGGVNLATFTGVARFDNALQVPHLILLILIINWALARRFSSAFLRVSLAVLIVMAPVIWLQPRILYVDVAYAAAVLGSIFAAVLVREFRRFDVVIAGILVAAVFATKPTGILTGLIVLVVMVVVVALRRRGLARVRSTVGMLVLCLGIPLVLGASFYVRNLFQFGNPIYPVQAKFGPIILPGILDFSVFASGDKGNGFVDPSRLGSFFGSIGFGMVHGVTKLDYDPRVGGFGYVTLAVLVVAVAVILVQILLRLRARGTTTPKTPMFVHWRAQLGIVLVTVLILVVQPSTFDARYVIGPTIALLVAVLLTVVFAVPTVIQLTAGVVVLLMAGCQLWWTERHTYPGIMTSMYLASLPSAEQANTPGNPWGRGVEVSWLPSDPGTCVSIALETSGGLTPAGMGERSFLGTLSYGLYGDALCNRVHPVTWHAHGNARDAATIEGADYVVLYKNDVDRWEKEYPRLASCLVPVDSIKGNASYPQADVVLRNGCAG